MSGGSVLPEDARNRFRNSAEMNALAAVSWLIARRVGFPVASDPARIRWSELGPEFPQALRAHGVVTLAVESPDFDRLPDGLSQRTRAMAADEMLRSMRRCAVQRKVMDTLAVHGVEALALKGLAFSAVAYGNWSSRGTAADLDLLVPHDQVGLAESTFGGLGIGPRGGIPLAPLSGALGRYALWLHYERAYGSDRYGHVDLHWRPLPGNASWNSYLSCSRSRRQVSLPGMDVWTLGPVETLLVAWSHGESESWRRLKRLADLWVAWGQASDEQRSAAMSMTRFLRQSIELMPERWAGIGSERERRIRVVDSNIALWRMRAGSGSVASAALRAGLGKGLPAKRISDWLSR